MFTIKLYLYDYPKSAEGIPETPVKLAQAETIDIEVYDEDNHMKMIIATSGRDDTFRQESFLIGEPENRKKWDPSIRFYDKTYIENETGATTQVVRKWPGSSRKP
jgi:hypothetical protein